jgi:thiol-disulfide isomerase/thioredoxin
MIIALVAAASPASAQPYAADAGIPWLSELDVAMARAAKEDKYIVLDIYAAWCGPCQQMKRTTWVDPKVVQELSQNFIPLHIDADVDGITAAQYGADSLPTVLVLTPSGTPFARKVGYQSADTFLAFLYEASQMEGRIAALKKSVEDNPDDVQSVLDLADLQRMFDKTDESILMLQRYRNLMDENTPEDTRARFAYQLGLAHLIQQHYSDGLSILEPFLTTYKSHELADMAVELYGIGTVEYARSQVELGRDDDARKLLADLGARENEYLKQMARTSLTMLDAIKAKQAELEESSAAPTPAE